jgi:neural Wiskott-Aldrich syndrome protein
MPSTLTSDDKAKIKRAIPKASNKILTAAVARLYVAFPDPGQWKHTGIAGAVVLSKDNVGDTYFLKIVDVVGQGQVLWDHELWKGFEYNQDRTFFHSFESQGILIGLSFADDSEAQGFYKKVAALRLGKGFDTLFDVNSSAGWSGTQSGSTCFTSIEQSTFSFQFASGISTANASSSVCGRCGIPSNMGGITS